MTPTTRHLLPILATAALALSACGDDNNGTAIGGEPTTPAPPATSQPATSTPGSAPAANPLDGKVACELVTEADIAKIIPNGFKLTEPPTDNDDPYQCRFQFRKGTEGVFGIGPVIRPSQGLDQVPFQDGVNRWTVTDGKVDKVRPAVQAHQVREAGQSCWVYMEISPTSRVDVGGSALGEDSVNDVVCDVASDLALLVHEKLVKEGL